MTIKELRTEKKLTQAAFAQSIGVGLSTVGSYEIGRIQPSQAVIDRIRELYGVEITPVEKPAEKPAKKPAKKAAEAPAKAKKAPAKSAAAKKPAKTQSKKTVEADFIIQSSLGGEITPSAIMEKIGEADKIYIRVDLNKAYWVRGNETGSVDLW